MAPPFRTCVSFTSGRILLRCYLVGVRMDASDSDPRILDAVETSLCHDPDVEFVVLFGSQITGDSRPSSDVDLAVKFTDSLPTRDRFQKRCFLSGDIQQDGIPFIDVSDIQ
jgi:predicted nucleotidyltransferase